MCKKMGCLHILILAELQVEHKLRKEEEGEALFSVGKDR